jgi:hypothetical protein
MHLRVSIRAEEQLAWFQPQSSFDGRRSGRLNGHLHHTCAYEQANRGSQDTRRDRCSSFTPSSDHYLP